MYTDTSGNTAEYYYVTNLRGDVVAIVDGTGATVVQYTYDAWGKVLTTTYHNGCTASTAAIALRDN